MRLRVRVNQLSLEDLGLEAYKLRSLANPNPNLTLTLWPRLLHATVRLSVRQCICKIVKVTESFTSPVTRGTIFISNGL